MVQQVALEFQPLHRPGWMSPPSGVTSFFSQSEKLELKRT